MFFILSKLLIFFIQPINWVFAFLLIAAFSRGPKWRKRGFRWAFGLFIFFTNPILTYLIVDWWEPSGTEIQQLDEASYDIGLVLGGYVNFRSIAPDDRVNFNERGNRLINALELYKVGKVDQLLLSGGIGMLFDEKFEVADEILVLLDRLEIPDSAIIQEGQSRNTYENIVNSKAIIDSLHPNPKILLFTSAFHMPRALAICKKQGLEVTPYPTDIMHKPISWSPRDWLLPDTGGFHVWSLHLKEWVGYLVYKLRGYA